MTIQYRAMPGALQTARLDLRPRDPTDAAWNLRLLQERVGGTTHTLDDIERRLDEQVALRETLGISLYSMTLRSGGTAVGYCGLIVGRATLDEPELAYELFKAFWGLGYATEAAASVVEAAFETGRSRLWATVGTWNAASLRVLEKVGFVRDHTTVEVNGEVVWMTIAADSRS